MRIMSQRGVALDAERSKPQQSTQDQPAFSSSILNEVSKPNASHWQAQMLFSSTLKTQKPADIQHIEQVIQGNTPLDWKKVSEVDGGSFGKVEVYHFSDPDRPEAKPQKFYAWQQPGVGLVTLGSSVPHGSADEYEPKLHGFFHFLEHLFFKGTGDGKGGIIFPPGGFDKALAKTYARVNANTGWDSTQYFIMTSPSEMTQDNLMRHGMFMQDPALIPKGVNSERGTVIEEINQYASQLPYRMQYQMFADIFGEHPYGHPILGTKQSVTDMSVDTIREMYNHHYGQSHRNLLMVGDFNTSETLKTVSKTFNVTPERYDEDYAPPVRPEIPKRSEVIHRTFYDEAFDPANASIEWTYRGPKPESRREYAALEFVDVLGFGAPTSYGVQQVVNKDQKAFKLHTGYHPLADGALFQLEGLMPRENLAEVTTQIEQVFDRIRNGDISDEEFILAKNELLKQHANLTEDQPKMFNYLNGLVNRNQLELFGDSYKTFIESITLQEVQDVANKYLVPGRKVEYTVLSSQHQPEAEKTTKNEKEKTAKTKPIQFSGRLDDDPRVTSQRLESGAELILDERPGRSKVAMTLTLPGGNRLADYPGELKLLAHLMKRANANQSDNELAKFITNNRLDFAVKAENDSINIQIEGEPEHLKAMVELLQNTLLNPQFEPDDMERQKQILLAEYNVASTNIPGMTAEVKNLKKFYPKGHPYGGSIGGIPQLNGPPGLLFTRDYVEETIDKITPQRLKVLHQSIFQPKNMTISVVGKIDVVDGLDLATEVEQILKNVNLTNQKSKADAIKLHSATVPIVTEDIIDVHIKEGSLQHSQIVQSWPVDKLNDKDTATMALLHGIIHGVGMSARLFQALREGPDGGLVYHAHGIHFPYREGGRFKLYAGTEHGKLITVLNVLDKVIKDIVNPDFSQENRAKLEEELETAKGTLKHNHLVASMKTANKSADVARHRAFDTKSAPEVFELFDSITLEDIQQMAQTVFDKPSITTILTTAESAQANKLPANGKIDRKTWFANQK